MNMKNNHPLANMSDDTRIKLLMIAIWKMNGEKPVRIEIEDVQAFHESFGDLPTLMMRGQGETGIEVSITTVGKATLEAAVMNQGG